MIPLSAFKKLSGFEQRHGYAMACCPNHDDQRPSLRWRESSLRAGFGYLDCFGCGEDWRVLEAAIDGDRPKVKIKTISTAGRSSLDWLANYCAIDGDLLKAQALRFTRERIGFIFDGSNAVKWREVNPSQGGKGWQWESEGDDTPPLWPIPPTPLPETICLSAGETDTLCLRAAGFTAFALTKGEGSVPDVAVFAHLRQRGANNVVYAADVDAAGRKKVDAVRANAEAAGLDFKILDLTPYLEPLGGEKDVRALNRRVGSKQLQRIVTQALSSEPATWSKTAEEVIVMAREYPIEWILEPLIAVGEVTLIAGKPKAGKTTFICKAIEQMRLGGEILGLPVQKSEVLIWSERSLRINGQRFQVLFAGVEQPQVHLVTRFDERLKGLSFRAALHEVIDEALRLDCRLIVLDTFSALARLEEESRSEEVQEQLDAVAKFADEFQIAIVLVHHKGKSNAIRGSSVFEAEPSTIVEIDGEYENERTLRVRSNIETVVPEPIVFLLNEEGGYEIASPSESDDGRAVLAILTVNEALLATEILKALEWAASKRFALKRLLDAMVKDGKVGRKTKIDQKRKPRDAYYKMAKFTIVPIHGRSTEER